MHILLHVAGAFVAASLAFVAALYIARDVHQERERRRNDAAMREAAERLARKLEHYD